MLYFRSPAKRLTQAGNISMHPT